MHCIRTRSGTTGEPGFGVVNVGFEPLSELVALPLFQCLALSPISRVRDTESISYDYLYAFV